MKKNIYATHSIGYDNVVLDPYEQEIEDALTRGTVSQFSKTERERLSRLVRKAARNTVAKNKSVTFRVNAWDIERLKARAMQDGMPYQTLLSSILHKYVSGTLKDMR